MSSLNGDSTPSLPTCVMVDDHELIRVALRVALEEHGAVRVVGQANCATDALRMVLELRPDLVVVDLRLPDEDGIWLTRQIRSAAIDARILVMSGDAGLPLIEEAFAAGADGFVSKLSSVEMVVAAVDALRAHRKFIDPAVASEMVDPLRVKLTAQEQKVLALLVAGCQNDEIALRLSISSETAKSHVANVLKKMHVSSRSAAAMKAVREGFVL